MKMALMLILMAYGFTAWSDEMLAEDWLAREGYSNCRVQNRFIPNWECGESYHAVFNCAKNGSPVTVLLIGEIRSDAGDTCSATVFYRQVVEAN